MRTKPDYYYNQSGVIPYRFENGVMQILLISSRKKKRMVIPKGIIEDFMTSVESAEKEAFEEAGVKGATGDRIGEFKYKKWGDYCAVEVFPLEVKQILDEWPENNRDRKWMGTEEAANNVKERDLRIFIRKLPKLLELRRI